MIITIDLGAGLGSKKVVFILPLCVFRPFCCYYCHDHDWRLLPNSMSRGSEAIVKSAASKAALLLVIQEKL